MIGIFSNPRRFEGKADNRLFNTDLETVRIGSECVWNHLIVIAEDTAIMLTSLGSLLKSYHSKKVFQTANYHLIHVKIVQIGSRYVVVTSEKRCNNSVAI